MPFADLIASKLAFWKSFQERASLVFVDLIGSLPREFHIGEGAEGNSSLMQFFTTHSLV